MSQFTPESYRAVLVDNKWNLCKISPYGINGCSANVTFNKEWCALELYKSSKILIKKFILYGFLAGIIYGVATVIYAYIKSPGPPGEYEIYIHLIIIFLYGILIALLGLIIGLIIAGLKKTK